MVPSLHHPPARPGGHWRHEGPLVTWRTDHRAERQWLEANGFDAFVELLDAKAVNYTDLQRPSVV
ncbi:hypothetical protein JCM18916_2356 [Cutibacterium acnes JCM 18916]|nr:hypothetical protein JCM18916_2356 [Cutibacterium acnes JCM 18916]GAE80866.1 hypothetical protein JCM18920_2573 [Cutibacterium acnes JCM 18920]